MRNVLIFFISQIISFSAYSQKDFRKNTFYFEIGGNGPVLSVNYERQITNKPGFGVHIGAGLGNIKPTIPIGITYINNLGKKRSYLETGLGITLIEESLIVKHISNLDSYSYTAAFIPSIGFRHHTDYGLMWKLIYSPFFTTHRSAALYFGASIGWRI